MKAHHVMPVKFLIRLVAFYYSFFFFSFRDVSCALMLLAIFLSFQEAISTPWKSLPRRVSKLYLALRGTQFLHIFVELSQMVVFISDLCTCMYVLLFSVLCMWRSYHSHMPCLKLIYMWKLYVCILKDDEI